MELTDRFSRGTAGGITESSGAEMERGGGGSVSSSSSNSKSKGVSSGMKWPFNELCDAI